jgi:predicted Na+-dependent transporter
MIIFSPLRDGGWILSPWLVLLFVAYIAASAWRNWLTREKGRNLSVWVPIGITLICLYMGIESVIELFRRGHP